MAGFDCDSVVAVVDGVMSGLHSKYHNILQYTGRLSANFNRPYISKTTWSMFFIFCMCSYLPHIIILTKFHENLRGSPGDHL